MGLEWESDTCWESQRKKKLNEYLHRRVCLCIQDLLFVCVFVCVLSHGMGWHLFGFVVHSGLIWCWALHIRPNLSHSQVCSIIELNTCIVYRSINGQVLYDNVCNGTGSQKDLDSYNIDKVRWTSKEQYNRLTKSSYKQL